VVGDRLDTDIEGANAVGCPSLLVLSGVTTAHHLLSASPKLRPTYLAADVGGLLLEHPEPADVDAGYRVGGWQVRAAGAELRLECLDATDDVALDATDDMGRNAIDALRALCATAWCAGSAGAGANERFRWSVVADGDGSQRTAAEKALRELDLA
jgi:hypothetical protein